jgi:FtsP/CotA-like multicopper oxidase with cupredoxin domain
MYFNSSKSASVTPVRRSRKFHPAWKFAAVAVITVGGCLRADAAPTESGSPRVKLFVREESISVLGKTVKVGAIRQADGEPGFSPEMTTGFHVEVVNQLPVPTALHWHGLILPNLMDGVPYVTQDPIPPGGSHNYDFPLQQSGTYWMHSHYGLQEQQLVVAPMVIRGPPGPKVADAEVTVTLSDFSFSSPAQILKGLAGGGDMKKNIDGTKGIKDTKDDGMKGMNTAGMSMSGPDEDLVVQQWDAASNRLVSRQTKRAAPDIDVKYDALLANLHSIDQPQVVSVKPGTKVLLRFLAASSATNFFIDAGGLEATIVAVDGEEVQPLKGNFFQLAIAQRLDLLVTIPNGGGAFPILALGEGTTLQTGIVLATPGAELSKSLGIHGQRTMGALDNTQELRLSAREPLPDKPVQRSLSSVLGGSMMPYRWTINGAPYPNSNSLDVKRGERVELVIKNETGMSHPMHLHGHVFEVTEIDGQRIEGAKRDTISVPPKSTIRVVFDANNPGVWPYHCHIVYHMATGMFTVLKYESADTKYWQPDRTKGELENPLNFGRANWSELTEGLFAADETPPNAVSDVGH